MNSRIFLAIALIVIGTLFLFDRLGIYEFSYLISTWWPSILIIFGIISLVRSHSIMPGITLFLIGTLLQAQRLDWIEGGFWDIFWPLILVLAGISILTNKRHIKSRFHYQEGDNTLNYFNMFSGLRQKPSSGDFKGGSVVTMFGGAEVDLRDCIISPEGAVLDLSASFGGIEIYVPNNWKIEATGVPLFGGFDDKTRQVITDYIVAPTLKIHYFAMFGGVEVRN